MVKIRNILKERGFNLNDNSVYISEGIRTGTHGWFDIILIKAVFKTEMEMIKGILSREGFIVRDEPFNHIEVDWNRYFDCEKFENRLG